MHQWKKSGPGADVLNSPAGGLAASANRLHQYGAKIVATGHAGRFGHPFRRACHGDTNTGDAVPQGAVSLPFA